MRQQTPTLSADAAVPRLHVCATAWRPSQPDGGRVRQRWLDAQGRLVATGGMDGGHWWMHWPALGTYVFGASGHVLVHPEPGGTLAALNDSYTRGVVPVVMLAREREALHASGVVAAGGVVAFCAVSGTGKSSLARAVVAPGLAHWADDTVVLEFEGARVESVALPCAPRLDEAAAAAIAPSGSGATAAPGTRTPLSRIYFVARDPALDPAAPRLAPVDGSARFERLLAHAHPFELAAAHRWRRTVERLLRVAATTPMFELQFAPSLAHLPRLAGLVRAHVAAA